METGAKGESLRVRQVATGSIVEIRAAGAWRSTLCAGCHTRRYVRRLREARRPAQYELWQIPFLGGSPRQLLTGIGSGVAFSPDGRRMAYVRSDAVGQTEVVIAAADGSGAQVLATRQPARQRLS